MILRVVRAWCAPRRPRGRDALPCVLDVFPGRGHYRARRAERAESALCGGAGGGPEGDTIWRLPGFTAVRRLEAWMNRLVGSKPGINGGRNGDLNH